jgi:hypothetical protein
VLCETYWQQTNGWPKVLETCKGEDKEMRLDQHKRGNLKAKREVCNFCITYVVDHMQLGAR